MLTVNVMQLTPEKQYLISPNSDDSGTSAETFPRERNVGIIEGLRMQLQGQLVHCLFKKFVTQLT